MELTVKEINEFLESNIKTLTKNLHTIRDDIDVILSDTKHKTSDAAYKYLTQVIYNCSCLQAQIHLLNYQLQHLNQQTGEPSHDETN